MTANLTAERSLKERRNQLILINLDGPEDGERKETIHIPQDYKYIGYFSTEQ